MKTFYYYVYMFMFAWTGEYHFDTDSITWGLISK